MSKKRCPKCGGTGDLPQWPSPYTPLPSGVISAIKTRAHVCDLCDGTGYVEEESDEW